MPWSNQSGGGGGSNGGGPWKPSNNPNPWGGGPPSGGGGSGGRPPNLEDLFKRGQDKIKDFVPGGPIGGIGIAIVGLLAVLGWLLTGFYTVRPDEVGLNVVFGRYVNTTQPGLNYNWPYPIGSVVKPRVTAVNTMEVGVRQGPEVTRRPGSPRVLADESLMLTGDENIVDVDFTVQWQISPDRPQDYVFNLRNQESTVKLVAESVMREVIGKRDIDKIITIDRATIETEVRTLMQSVLDKYGAGVTIRFIQLLKAEPPTQVIDAYRDVQAARADFERLKNEADTYAKRIVPEARGEAVKIEQEAEAYNEQTVAEAKGAAKRFAQVLDEYRKAPRVTRERMFLETMERVFGRMDKIIIDQNKGGGVVPYLPLNELNRPAQPVPPSAPRGATR
jgi:membrane protease subunit HflK